MTEPQQRWPADFSERYRRLGYWRGETIGGMLRATARRLPEAIAVVGDGERWSYAALDARADSLATAFRDLGIKPGERVLVQIPNRPTFLSVVFGLYRAGILPVFCLPAHRRAEIAHFAAASEAVAYIVADRHDGFDYRPMAAELRAEIPALRNVIVDGAALDPDAPGFLTLADLAATPPREWPEPDPSSVAFLQLSGGSTGFSKLIPRTHDDYLYSVRGSAEICGLDERGVYLCVLPIAHNFPTSSPGYLGVLHAGGCVVMCPTPSPDVAFRLIEEEGVTITGVVPPIALLWLRAVGTTTHDLSSLRLLQVGGARLPPEIARQIGPAFGTTLQQVFGMAEGLVNYTRLDDPEEIINNTQGRPISPDDEVLIVDDSGAPVPDGVPGNLLTRGPYTIRAYHNAPEANARAFTGDGFYRTGDIVSRSAGGYLTVHGRATDLINRGGEKVSPDEVEDHLLAHSGIHDVAVVGVADEYLGERSCAVVVPRGEGLKVKDVKAWLRSRGVAAYKIPDQVVFVPAFPETGVGKTSRKDLRAAVRAYLDREAAGKSAATDGGQDGGRDPGPADGPVAPPRAANPASE